jgi:Cu(I)/Ag(I) efflux system membrane protein CusA/SilA
MIDAAIVMIENLHKHMERNRVSHPPRTHWQLVRESAQEVGGSLFISLLIITASFLPVFALQDQEGRLFKPLAWTKTLAMGSAALLSITLVPVAMGYFIRGDVKPEQANPINHFLIRIYRPAIQFVLRHRWQTVAVALAVLLITIVPYSRLGSEFMPPLNEGSIMDMPSLFPGVGAGEAKRIIQQRDAALARIPEVEMVLGKIGRAETATDMAPLSMIETIAVLKDKSQWRRGVSYDSIVSEANNTVRTPGVGNMWSMPIKNRLDMLATGIKTPVGIKIFGPDLATLDKIGKQIEGMLPAVRGTNTVFAERAIGGRYLDVTIDRAATARYGLSGDEVQMALSTAVGGMEAGQVIEGREKYGVLVRYPRELRDDPLKIADVLVTTPSGAQVALGELSRISVVEGSTLIKSEDAYLDNIVYVDVRDRDVGSYVEEGKALLEKQLRLPPGYRLQWSGQYESMQRASQRLRVVVPITLLIIFGLLYFNFRSIAESLIVMLSLPFALAGGVWLMWILGYNLSVAVAIGFIALAGVAAQTAVILLIYLDQAWHRVRGERENLNKKPTRDDLQAAVEFGTVERLRPKTMTVAAVTLSLLPILWSQETGSDVLKRIAAPMVGGLITSAALTLIVLPVVYSLWREWEIKAGKEIADRCPEVEAAHS